MRCELCRSPARPVRLYDRRGYMNGWICMVCHHGQYDPVGRMRARAPSARQAVIRYAMDFIVPELARRIPAPPIRELAEDITRGSLRRLMVFAAKYQRGLVPRPLYFYVEAAYTGGPEDIARLIRLLLTLGELEQVLARMAARNMHLPVSPIDFRLWADRAATDPSALRRLAKAMQIRTAPQKIWRARLLMALALYRPEDGEAADFIRAFARKDIHPEAEKCPLDQRPDLWEMVYNISMGGGKW